jgi:hypothetical protein
VDQKARTVEARNDRERDHRRAADGEGYGKAGKDRSEERHEHDD